MELHNLEERENVACRHARAAMDYWLDWDFDALELEEWYPDHLSPSRNGGPGLLTGHNCPPQTRHNDLST